jgi:DNA-binding NarL/FixJ family response regulator
MKKLKVLLADDHDLVRQGMAALIGREAGWKICGEAKTGREAVREALRVRPDIAVVDLGLPEVDGLEVTRRIRKQLPGCEVIIFTGSGESDELIREAFASGAKSFILKAEAAEFLIAALKSVAAHTPFFTDRASAVLFARFARQKSPAGQNETESTERLSPREQGLVRLLADGHSNESVAKKQHISVRAVENQRAGIMKKLQLTTFAGLVRYAVRNGIIEA